MKPLYPTIARIAADLPSNGIRLAARNIATGTDCRDTAALWGGSAAHKTVLAGLRDALRRISPRLSPSTFSRRSERKRTMSNIQNKITKFAKQLDALEQEWNALKCEIDGKIAAMKQQAEAVQQANETAKAKPPAKSQAKEQSGKFPYPVGAMVKVAFPELFKRKLISAGDVAYLLSKKASSNFKMRGNAVLRIYTTDDDPGLFANGHRRYYREIPLLELGAKRYHLSSQFFPESRDAVLKWVYAHALKKKDLIAAIEAKASSK